MNAKILLSSYLGKVKKKNHHHINGFYRLLGTIFEGKKYKKVLHI